MPASLNSSQPWVFEVAGQTGDSEDLAQIVRDTKPDVVVLDIRMPPTHTLEGLHAARVIRTEHGAAVGVVLLSQHVETRYAVDLLGGGAAGIGYLLKDRILDPADLADAILRVGNGGSAIDPVVIEQLLRRRQADACLPRSTARERDAIPLAWPKAARTSRSPQSCTSARRRSKRAPVASSPSSLSSPAPTTTGASRAVLTYLEAMPAP